MILDEKNPPLMVVITLNWNGLRHLKYFLPSAVKLNYPNYKIIVVDNNSDDDSIKYLRRNYKDAIIVESPKNVGYSRGFNLGIEKALSMNADYLLITNNDIELDHLILKAAIDLFVKEDKIGYMSGKIYDLNHRKRFQRAGGRPKLTGRNRGAFENDNGQYDKIEYFEFMDDVCGVIPSEVIKKVGPYDKDFFYDFEEAELHLRMKSSGYRLAYNPKMVAWHSEHGSTANTHFSPIPQYYHYRGELIFYYKTSTSNFFISFIIPFLFFKIPKRWFILVKKNKVRLIYYNLMGVISGLKYIIKS